MELLLLCRRFRSDLNENFICFYDMVAGGKMVFLLINNKMLEIKQKQNYENRIMTDANDRNVRCS